MFLISLLHFEFTCSSHSSRVCCDGEGKGAAEADREQDQSPGHLLEEAVGVAEEGARDLRALRRRGRRHRLLPQREAL